MKRQALHAMTKPSKTTAALLFALLLFTAFHRVLRVEFLPELPNFSPVMAVAFCGAMFLPGVAVAVVVFGGLVVSDLLLNLHYGTTLFGAGELLRYTCYGAVMALAFGLRRHRGNPFVVFGGIIGCGVVFYVITNTAAWFGHPAYPQSFAGWVQALTVGLPGFPPSWMFFRNALAGDVIFTAVFLLAFHLATRRPVAHPNRAVQIER